MTSLGHSALHNRARKACQPGPCARCGSGGRYYVIALDGNIGNIDQCNLATRCARCIKGRTGRPAYSEADVLRQIDKSGGPDACWPWTGFIDPHGYGAVTFAGMLWRAHRLAWCLANGVLEPPAGLVVRHFVCDNPPCCNPAHLRVGTNAENTGDMMMKGRQARGSRVGSSVLTEQQVMDLRALSASSFNAAAMALLYGVSAGSLAEARFGRTWAHLPGAVASPHRCSLCRAPGHNSAGCPTAKEP